MDANKREDFEQKATKTGKSDGITADRCGDGWQSDSPPTAGRCGMSEKEEIYHEKHEGHEGKKRNCGRAE